MAIFALTNLHIAVDNLNLSCFANQVDVMAEADELDVTTFCGGGYRQKITGLASLSVNASGFQDYTSPAPGTVLNATTDLVSPGTTRTFTVAPQGDTVGNTAYLGAAKATTLNELSGAVGEVAAFSLNLAGTSRLIKGKMLHAVAAETATGSGTITTMAGPSATQSLYAAFHVYAVTGTGTITMNVQTDDNATPTSPTTRITSTAFAAVGSELKSVAGAFASETHIRVIWTIAGFTSVTFSVAAGVAAT